MQSNNPEPPTKKTNKMSGKITAFPYLFNRKQPDAVPLLAISNRGGTFPRVLLHSKEETFALINELIQLAERQETWELPTVNGNVSIPNPPSSEHGATKEPMESV